MENQYQNLNKKLDTLIKNNPKQHNMQKATQFQPKVINLSDKHFTKEQISIISLGPKHAIEKELKKYINELIVDTEVAIPIRPQITKHFSIPGNKTNQTHTEIKQT